MISCQTLSFSKRQRINMYFRLQVKGYSLDAELWTFRRPTQQLGLDLGILFSWKDNLQLRKKGSPCRRTPSIVFMFFPTWHLHRLLGRDHGWARMLFRSLRPLFLKMPKTRLDWRPSLTIGRRLNARQLWNVYVTTDVYSIDNLVERSVLQSYISERDPIIGIDSSRTTRYIKRSTTQIFL